jgi:hypothetical protein
MQGDWVQGPEAGTGIYPGYERAVINAACSASWSHVSAAWSETCSSTSAYDKWHQHC